MSIDRSVGAPKSKQNQRTEAAAAFNALTTEKKQSSSQKFERVWQVVHTLQKQKEMRKNRARMIS